MYILVFLDLFITKFLTEKNILHYETDLFWLCRKIVLNRFSNCFIKKYCSIRMLEITRKYNSVIPIQAIIKGKPIMPHGLMNVYISKKAQIGKNVTIFQNVTIGSNLKIPGGAPRIGDDVLIGANSVIVGDISIENNVKIGAGCAVATDIPSDTTVVSQKVRVIKKR